MSNLRRDIEIQQIIEEYKKGQFSEEVAMRELLLLGCDRYEIKKAIGQVQLNG